MSRKTFEASVSRIPSPEERANALRLRLAGPVADQFPAFVSLMGDALGHLWVEEFEPPGEGGARCALDRVRS